MTNPDNTTKPQMEQPPNIVPRHEYDLEMLDDFLDLVFPKIYPDEHVLTWATKGIPGYPQAAGTMMEKLTRIPAPMALYFGTSTVTPEPNTQRLFNRKALFKRFFVLVLDDIGTKIPLNKIPKALKPTYIIETSKGNFQYGYVLKTPIDDLVMAETLVQLVYDAGYSDDGGKMATKLVRLPEGVNGKKGKHTFPVTLKTMKGPKWTPKKILDVLDLGVTWADVKKDALAVQKARANVSMGTSVWSPIALNSANLDGTVDPVLEWLYDENMVKQETNDWVTIKCPWSDEHTDSNNDTAGYSPIGRGDDGHTVFRGFHCFHQHCNDHHAKDFLTFVAGAGGPECAVTEQVAHLVVDYAYDPMEDAAWKIKGVNQAIKIPLKGFKNLHPHKCVVQTADDKKKTVAETALWIQAKNRVDVWGQTSDPSTESKLVQREGLNYVNMFLKPPWGDGEYDKNEVDRFVNFIEYLIPAKEMSNYFLDWLACKTQDMSFRGAGIVMVAKAQGTGRTTLAGMLRDMFLAQNVMTIPYEHVIGGGSFNEWMTSPIIVSNETLATADTSNRYRSYERLKEIVDTQPIDTRINPKYGRQRVEKVYSSFLFLSNHADAIAASKGDRRLYVLDNVSVPARGEFFRELNEWLDRKEWMPSVWRWLRQREVDLQSMLEGAPMTRAKQEMLSATTGAMDIAIETILDEWPANFITAAIVKDILEPYAYRIADTDLRKFNKMLMIVLRAHTTAPHMTVKRRYRGHAPTVPRAILKDLPLDITRILMEGTAEQIGRILTKQLSLIEETDILPIREAVGAALEDALA